MYARAGTRTRIPSESERRLLLSVSDFVEAGFPIDADTSAEVWVARSHPDGVSELKYSYTPEDALPGYLRLYVVTRIERATSNEHATELFRAIINDYTNGIEKSGGRFVFKGNLQAWCDDAYVGFTLAEPNETVVGCLLSFHKERMVYTIMLRGILLEDEEVIEELVYPFLDSGLRWCSIEA